MDSGTEQGDPNGHRREQGAQGRQVMARPTRRTRWQGGLCRDPTGQLVGIQVTVRHPVLWGRRNLPRGRPCPYVSDFQQNSTTRHVKLMLFI